MIKRLAPLAVVGFVAACGGNPFNFSGEPVPPPPPGELGEDAPILGVEVPAIVAQHLRSASYTPGAAEMKVDLRTLDGSPLEATYRRNSRLDVAGYDAYEVQETRSQRKFLALFRQSGAVQAGVVADGGQFANYFGGATFTRLQPLTLPSAQGPGATLLATYSGAYVGLLNAGTTVPHPGAPFDPEQSARISGEVMLNADFNAQNMSVNGGVRNRVIEGSDEALQDIFFNVTDVNGQGAFSGVIKMREADSEGNPVPGGNLVAVGNYAGVFGGTGASDVAGGTVLSPIPGSPNLREHGAFAVPVCGPSTPAPYNRACP